MNDKVGGNNLLVRDQWYTEEKLRLIFEASPNAMVLVDDRGSIRLANTQTEKLFGYSPEELLGQSIELLVPEKFQSLHAGVRAEFFQNSAPRAMGSGRELSGRRKDGAEVPVEIGLTPIKTDEGLIVLASIIDITERKRIEQISSEVEDRLHTVIENLTEGLVISDLDGQLLHWNRAGLEMHGFSSLEECLLRLPELERIFELSTLEGKILKLEEWPLPRVIAGESLTNYDLCVRRLDREWQRIFRYVGSLVKEPSGKELAFVSITDITVRALAERELRGSQEQMAGIIGSAMDAIISIDEEQRIVLFNNAAERMFLYPAEEAIGQSLDRFIPERFRRLHKHHITEFGKTNVTKRSMGTLDDLFARREDGEEFPIEASISQIESSDRKLFTVILRDVTARKRTEEALREQARILDLAPVLIRDMDARIIFWNRGSEQMFGWTSEEALDKPAHTLLQARFPRALEEIKARLLTRGHWRGEVVKVRKDGQPLVIDSQWVLHRDEQGKPKAVLEVNNDITERKQAEHEIRRLNEELEQRVADRTAQLQAANRELEAFSYSVSHDLRAPLRHINGFSQALLEDCADQLDEIGKSYLQQVRDASQEMAQLIDDVLQLARVTRSEMRRELINLSELARSIVSQLQNRESQREVEIEIQDRLETLGDKRLLGIMLTNLLGNAWKFTSKQKHARISFTQDRNENETFYVVRDNGAGFDMNYAGKLFGAFQRLHTNGEFEGTGIGLATVQRIVQRHGGRVWAEGYVDKGAAFFFTLPRYKEQRDDKQFDLTG